MKIKDYKIVSLKGRGRKKDKVDATVYNKNDEYSSFVELTLSEAMKDGDFEPSKEKLNVITWNNDDGSLNGALIFSLTRDITKEEVNEILIKELTKNKLDRRMVNN